MEATFSLSMQYQALIMTIMIVYNLSAGAITSICIWARKGHYMYGGGKRIPQGDDRPLFGTPYYWYRWFMAPVGWAPHWVWIAVGTLVFGATGVGAGFFYWIVNDYLNNYWLAIASFIIIIPPVLAAGWAIVFFCAQSFVGAAVVAFLWFASAAVVFSLAIVYPVYYTLALPYYTWAWLFMGLGTTLQLLWSAYVFGITVAVAVMNSGRVMEKHVADDEPMTEREASIVMMQNLSSVSVAAMNSPNAAQLEDMAAQQAGMQQPLLAQQQATAAAAALRTRVSTSASVGRPVS